MTSPKPSATKVAMCAAASALAMVLGVYFGGQGQLPLAMLAVIAFVLLGGITFELARRRSA